MAADSPQSLRVGDLLPVGQIVGVGVARRIVHLLPEVLGGQPARLDE